MGHIRLGDLYKTRRWVQVITLLDKEADPQTIASKSMAAAEMGFLKAANDVGFKYTVWLLTQIPLAAKESDFSSALNKLGLGVPKKAGLFDVLGAFTKHIDSYLQRSKARTDISEMAQLAAVEAFSRRCGESCLFGVTHDIVQKTIKDLSTNKNFALLARDFFSRFTYRYLNYFLSREVSKHVGPGRSIENIDKHTSFNEALELHCRQSAVILQKFAGGWFSKTAYETGITQQDAGGFTAVALRKLSSELREET
jgi:hypothetical protein